MIRVVVTEELRKGLLGLNQPLELVDESGRLMASVTPVTSRLPGEPEMTPEELRRIEAEEDFSLEEVLAHLKSLEGA